jgi:endoglucanase
MNHQGSAAVRQDMKSLLLVLTTSVCLQAAGQVQSPDAFEQNRRLGRGVNIIGYDRHLIVTVHYYKPMSFTHQGASWTGEKDKSGVTWGTDAERKAVQDEFAKVAAWAREHNRPIFLGEFGAYDKGPADSRVRYTDHVARTAEAAGWSWAYWQFDSDFILWDMKRDAWVEPILHALVPPKK